MATEVLITHENITQHWHKSYPLVTKLTWRINKLSRTVLRNFPNVTEFDCSGMSLTHLRGIEVLTNLKVLNCPKNWLRSIKQIRGLNLRELYCSKNELCDWGDTRNDSGNLDGIQTSTDLQILDCHESKISSLHHVNACTRLRELDCSDNCLQDTETIMYFPLLSKLNCKSNWFEGRLICSSELVELNCFGCSLHELDLRLCSKLRTVKCGSNRLSKIQGLSSCTALEFLDCHMNRLTGFDDMTEPINLRHIFVNSNWLVTLDFLKYIPNITYLPCEYNQLTTLRGVEYCKQLLNINCGRNKLTSLADLVACSLLQKVSCDRNSLTTLEPVAELVNLLNLDCGYNQLCTLDGIQTCTQLTNLICQNNQIVSIGPIALLTNLIYLNCSSNQIVSLEPLVYLRNLLTYYYHGNPLGVQSARFERFLETRAHRNYSRASTVYSNSQNVHDTHVQKSVCTSLVALLSDTKPLLTGAELLASILASDLDTKAKVLVARYCADKSMHSDHHINYEELLSYVWNRIILSEHTTELVKILSQQILDSEGMCFTGRFNRTLSVLVGYYDDIVINISDASRISAIILLIKNRMTEYDPVMHAEVATVELLEAGYTHDEIQSWIEAITEAA